MIDHKLPSINRNEIIKLLPHRDPMLLIDNLYNIVHMKSAIGHLRVTEDKFFLMGISQVNLLCQEF